ncbi:type IV pilus modification protein PilV [Polaromonas sp. SM01]|uniref:type IV pilus modification protein PilV n=1 Tax=Polaromonas sp. SM01 TaxID=3085630 RepID=UPI00298170B9|nr:type IV pilus modification protein PilV [Polaromonas sp. SM01]MDW5443225.1 type IV pilus modification protein PilV [Polaromonas sp. SM01]
MRMSTSCLEHGTSHRHQQHGVSLIEVLVSIVIASIGLLALAGVNASSIRYTKMSQYRGTATQLATDLGERMRANKVGAAGYALGTSFATQAALPSAAGTLCNSYAVTCTAAQLAAYDLQTWQVVVRSQLPEGSAYIVYQNVQSAADVWLVWRDPAVASADDAPTTASECPGALSVAASPSVRCSYFRINL